MPPLSTQEILQRLDFPQLLEACGFADIDPTRSTYQSHCVFHNDNRTKSFSANLDRKLFHCFSSACAVSGNGIHLYALHKGVSYTEALEQLRELFDGQVKPRPLEQLAVRSFDGELEWGTRTAVYTQFWSSAARLAAAPEIGAYLQRRGFQLDFLDSRGVRAVLAEQCLPPLVQQFGIRTLVQAGLLSSFSTAERWVASFHSPSVLFPFFLGAKVVYYQTRSLDPKAQPKYLNPQGYAPPCLYQHNALLAQDGVVYIAEGPIDTLSLEVLGRSPAVGLAGTQSFQEEWLADFRCADVVLCMDSDAAGQRAAVDLAVKLANKGIRVHPWTAGLPVKDVNELLQWKTNNRAAQVPL